MYVYCVYSRLIYLYRWLKQSQEIEQEEANPAPKVDLSLKAGQTITINLKVICPKKKKLFQEFYAYYTCFYNEAEDHNPLSRKHQQQEGEKGRITRDLDQPPDPSPVSSLRHPVLNLPENRI